MLFPELFQSEMQSAEGRGPFWMKLSHSKKKKKKSRVKYSKKHARIALKEHFTLQQSLSLIGTY